MDDITKKMITDPDIRAKAEEMAQMILHNEKQGDQFNAFISATKERLDKHFDHLGYTIFVYDKTNPKNKFLSVVSNTVPGYYLGKLIPFVTKHRETLRDMKKKLDRKLRRVQ